jgi:hypothetical protein
MALYSTELKLQDDWLWVDIDKYVEAVAASFKAKS